MNTITEAAYRSLKAGFRYILDEAIVAAARGDSSTAAELRGKCLDLFNNTADDCLTLFNHGTKLRQEIARMKSAAELNEGHRGPG